MNEIKLKNKELKNKFFILYFNYNKAFVDRIFYVYKIKNNQFYYYTIYGYDKSEGDYFSEMTKKSFLLKIRNFPIDII